MRVAKHTESDRKGEILAAIAREALQFGTLETQRTSADFQEVAVGMVRDALQRAYEAGRNSVRTGRRA